MVGRKKQSCYRKKRKGVFRGVQKQVKFRRVNPSDEVRNPTPNTSQTSSPSQSTPASEDNERLAASASRTKLSKHGFKDSSDEDISDESSSSEESEESGNESFDGYGEGYRLIDLASLSSQLSDLHSCEDGMYS